eukprot:scaffold304755_cov28-Tisochrysis_lutea.AAC.1
MNDETTTAPLKCGDDARGPNGKHTRDRGSFARSLTHAHGQWSSSPAVLYLVGLHHLIEGGLHR